MQDEILRIRGLFEFSVNPSYVAKILLAGVFITEVNLIPTKVSLKTEKKLEWNSVECTPPPTPNSLIEEFSPI